MEAAIRRARREISGWDSGIEDHGGLGGPIESEGLGQVVEESTGAHDGSLRPSFAPSRPSACMTL